MGYLVLPRKGPRPLGLAAQNLLALRVVSRPRRLYQLLVATHLSTAQGQLNDIGGTHHYVTAKQLFLQFMSPSLLTHCALSVSQVFVDTLPPSLACSFPGQKTGFLSPLVAAACARTCNAPFGLLEGARSPCPKPVYFSRQQPPPTPSSGEEESMLI